MRRSAAVVGVAGVLAVTALLSCRGRGVAPDERPRLVVVVVVDGLRADLVTRSRSALHGGIARLLEDGREFPGAVVDHAITVSHAGHVTIATGRYPAGHGIVDAAFAVPDGAGRRMVDALADPSASIVGDPGAPGVSPHLVEAPTLAEWAQAAHPGSRLVAVGGGAYSSLLHAGHARGDVLWFDRAVGAFVTSSAYADVLPEWVDGFNSERVPSYVARAARWESSVPEELAATLVPDDRPFEADGVHVTFPHVRDAEMSPPAGRESAAAWRWLTWGPFLDGAVLELALEGVEERRLGEDDAPDVLAVVLSQMDSVTHYYGPSSHEVADTLLRLDAELETFFDGLDERVGAGRWVCALTADHGMPEIPEQRVARGLPGRRLTAGEIEAILEPVRSAAGDPEAAAVGLAGSDAVAAVYTPAELGSGGGRDPFLELYRHSWRPDRVPRLPLFSLERGDAPIAEAGLMVRLEPGTVMDIDATNHGSPYEYDRRVPLILLGPGVAAGVSDTPARTVHVAPTLAALAGIPTPAILDGHPLPLR